MKKILFAILVVFAFASCADDESELTPTDGQYVAYTGDLVIGMKLKDGRCTYFVPFTNGNAVGSWFNLTTSGEYPNYTYRIDDFTVQAHFDSRDSFTATLDGVLSVSVNPHLHSSTELIVTAVGVQFRLDNTILDANKDGVLDSKQ